MQFLRIQSTSHWFSDPLSPLDPRRAYWYNMRTIFLRQCRGSETVLNADANVSSEPPPCLAPRPPAPPLLLKLEATTLRCLTQTGESLTSNLETPHAGGPRAPQPLARTSLETRKPLAGTEKGGGDVWKGPQNRILEGPQNRILEGPQNKILEGPRNKILEGLLRIKFSNPLKPPILTAALPHGPHFSLLLLIIL